MLMRVFIKLNVINVKLVFFAAFEKIYNTKKNDEK